MTELTDTGRVLVEAAYQLLQDPAYWVGCGETSLSAEGLPVKPRDPRACCWCIVGAIAYFAPGGIVPYDVLVYLDEKARLFSPVDLSTLGFGGDVELLNDKVLDHDGVVRFLQFLLQPTIEGSDRA